MAAPTEVQISVPEVARRLGLPGGDVYRLIFRGILRGAPNGSGEVLVSVASIDRYLAEHPVSSPEDR